MTRRIVKKTTSLLLAIFISITMLFGFSGCIYRATKRSYTRQLIAAIEANDMEELQRLVNLPGDLDAGPASLIDVDDLNLPPIIEAIRHNNFEAVKILVDGGADVNNTIGEAQSPLVCAIIGWTEVGDFRIPYYLIEHGADIHLTTYFSAVTPIYACAGVGDEEKKEEHFAFFEYLLQKGATFDEWSDGHIIFAASYSDDELYMLDYLLTNYEVDVNIRSVKDGETLLMRAANSSEALTICQYLLENGADKSLMNNEGKTAYDLAYENYQYWFSWEYRDKSDLVEHYRKLLTLLEN